MELWAFFLLRGFVARFRCEVILDGSRISWSVDRQVG